VERAAIELRGPDQAAWLRRLDEAHNDIRAALDWLTAHAEQAQALRFATAATWYWLRRNYFTDARRIIDLVEAADTTVDARSLAAALLAAARFASSQTDYPAQATYDRRSLELFHSLGDAAGCAEAVTDLGAAEWQQGQMDRARGHLEDGLARFRALGDRVGVATALLPLANLSRDTGHFETAQRLYAECLALRQASGDALGVAHVLNNSAWLGLYMGDMAMARRAEQALDIRRKFGARLETGVSQTLLAKIALAARDSASAETLLLDSLVVHREVGNRWGVALALEGLAELLAVRQPDLALQFAGAASSLRSAIERPLPAVEEPLFRATLRAAEAALGPNDAGDALLSGARLSMADAVSLALELRTSPRAYVGACRSTDALQSTLAWSYELLSPAESQLLRGLGVFVGGCSAEAAVVVLASDELDSGRIASGLDLLARHQLVHRAQQPDGTPRYTLLETVLAFAQLRLAESGELRTRQARHLDYFVGLAEAAEVHLYGAQQAVWLQRLELEQANLRAALSFALDEGLSEAGLRLVAALPLFWWMRGYTAEALTWFERVLALPETSTAPAILRAKAAHGAAVMANAIGDFARARSRLEEACVISARLAIFWASRACSTAWVGPRTTKAICARRRRGGRRAWQSRGNAPISARSLARLVILARLRTTRATSISPPRGLARLGS
jgi:hypothetical protein